MVFILIVQQLNVTYKNHPTVLKIRCLLKDLHVRENAVHGPAAVSAAWKNACTASVDQTMKGDWFERAITCLGLAVMFMNAN